MQERGPAARLTLLGSVTGGPAPALLQPRPGPRLVPDPERARRVGDHRDLGVPHLLGRT